MLEMDLKKQNYSKPDSQRTSKYVILTLPVEWKGGLILLTILEMIILQTLQILHFVCGRFPPLHHDPFLLHFSSSVDVQV